MESINARQQEILSLIRESILSVGQPPTVRELGLATGLKSSCSVQKHLDALEEKGYISRRKCKYRSIELLQDAATMATKRTVSVPLVGSVAAGTPILAEESVEDYLPLPDALIPRNKSCFALRVKGDSMINAGIPTIFLNAAEIGYTGTELQDAINSDPKALAKFETIRAHGAVKMGLIAHVDEAAKRQHTPKVAFVARPADYAASSGKPVKGAEIDLLVRAMSMGKLHHAMMGTAAVAIGTAAAIPGTLVNLAAGGGPRDAVRFGHPSGTLRVGAQAIQEGSDWVVKKAIMSRSARVLMEGWVRVPGDAF